MNNKIVVIISTGEAGKAHTGMMYAVNALKHAWMEEVQVVFFGPAEELLLKDQRLQQRLIEYQGEDKTAVACKVIAEEQKLDKQLRGLGVEVRYVGEFISNLIVDGYIPMVW